MRARLAFAVALGFAAPALAEEERVYLKQDGDVWMEVRRSQDGTLSRQPAAPPVTGTHATAPGSPATAALSTSPSLFRPWEAVRVGSWPEAVAVGDLNGDGRTDVALTTSFYFDPDNDNHLFVFLQDDRGRLQPPVKYPAGASPQSVAVGDVNGDGRQDVVVGNFGSSIGVFLQNASGSLDPIISYPTQNSLRVAVADLNGDGRQDVVSINWGNRGDGVDVFLQNAQGGLDPPVTYHVDHGGYDDLAVGDVNGDGRMDVVVMSGQGLGPNLGVLLQAASGMLEGPFYYDVGGNELAHGVAVGDVTGDGRQDVVISFGGNRPSSHVAVFPQGATGSLAAPTIYPAYDIPEPVEIADVDHDGRLDVVVAHGGWVKVGVHLQMSDGMLSPYSLYGVPYATHYNPNGLAVGDIDGDGQNDVVLADYNNGLVVLYSEHKTVDRDFDGDGKTDVAVYNEPSGYWVGFASSTGALGAVAFGGPGRRPAPGDFDGDGRTDIAVYDTLTARWNVMSSRTGGTLTLDLGAPGDLPLRGDFDGDRRADAAVCRPGLGRFLLLGSRTGATTVVDLGTPNQVPVPADYDGDRVTDVAAYDPATGVWTIRRSSDEAVTTVAYGGAGFAPVPGDYDGDGRADVAVYSGSLRYWFIRLSSTGATAAVPFAAADFAPVPGDYDGDGRTDLAVYRADGWWVVLPSRTGVPVAGHLGGPGWEPVR